MSVVSGEKTKILSDITTSGGAYVFTKWRNEGVQKIRRDFKEEDRQRRAGEPEFMCWEPTGQLSYETHYECICQWCGEENKGSVKEEMVQFQDPKSFALSDDGKALILRLPSTPRCKSCERELDGGWIHCKEVRHSRFHWVRDYQRAAGEESRVLLKQEKGRVKACYQEAPGKDWETLFLVGDVLYKPLDFRKNGETL